MDNPFALDYVEPAAEQVEETDVFGLKPIAATAPAAAPADVAPPALAPAKAAFVTAGIHRMSSADYHADPAPQPSLSSTIAKLITRKSPAHAWEASSRLNPAWEPTNKKTFDIGRAAHRAVLGSGDDYVAIPTELLAKNGAVSTTAAKDFVAATRSAGRTPLLADEVEQIHAMRAVACARLAEYDISLDPERSELSAFAEIDGIWCRAQFDNVPADPRLPIYDFKTCEDASPEACLKSILNYGYDVQAEHYRVVWKAVTGEDRRFVFIFQEKSAPHEVTLVSLSALFRQLGDNRAARARRIWRECITTNKWPGYPVGLHEVDAPAWLIEREYQEEM